MGYVLYALVGLVVGGIINALADDLPERRRPQTPHCPGCEQSYRPARWLGVTRRSCPNCGARERRRTWLIELGTALVFALLWWRFRVLSAELIVLSFYLSAFILILVTDMEHRLILHAVTFPSIAVALVASLVTITPRAALLGAVVGFVSFFIIYLLGGWVFGAGAMGFGDVTLATLIGAAAGFPMVVVGLLIGVLVGGVVTLGLLITRLRRLRSKVPYGPFLLAGGTAALLWGPQIIEWYLS